MSIVLLIIIGLCVGSFLNVCIYRIPRNQSVAYPRSFCPACLRILRKRDLVPVFSYIALRGKCWFCGAPFSLRYVIIELATAILFLWSFFTLGLTYLFVKVIIAAVFLIVIAFIDYDYQLILNKVLAWFAGTGLIVNWLTGHVLNFDMAIAGLAGGGFFLLIATLSKGGMGGGDIKLMAALGLWLGLKLTLLTVFLSFVIGGAGSALLLAGKIRGRRDSIPFGPFMAVAAFISMLYGREIIAWYLRTIMP